MRKPREARVKYNLVLDKDESHCEWSAVRDEILVVDASMTRLANRDSKLLRHKEISHTPKQRCLLWFPWLLSYKHEKAHTKYKCTFHSYK